MLNKEQLTLTMEIVNRAEKLGLMQGDKLTALIDLEKATEHFNLRLADMLNALHAGIPGPDIIITYDDCPEIRELYPFADVEEVQRAYSIAN